MSQSALPQHLYSPSPARMKFLDHIEKRFGHLAVPNVALGLVLAQLVIFAFILIGRMQFEGLLLVPKAVFAGEWWRLLSFVITPPEVATTAFSALFLAFFWYIFWMMSSALEQAWSVFRFNIYLLSGVLFTIAGVFIGQLLSPEATLFVSPRFLYLSVFFAFATLHPDMEFLLFFVLPVKVKWLAWILGGLTALGILFAPSMGERIALFATLTNYLLFFRSALTRSVQARKRQAKFTAERKQVESEARHQCSVCGATEQSQPDLDFRYRMVNGDASCICEDCRRKALKV